MPPGPRLVTPNLSAADFAKYGGRYTSAELDTWFVIRATEDRLEVRRRYGSWARLEPIAADRFIMGFEREADAAAR